MYRTVSLFFLASIFSLSVFAEDQLWACGYFKPGDNLGFDFTPCWQVSAGLGLSKLSPDDENSSWSLVDDSDTGFRLSVTYQAFRHVFFEAVYADLGEATFENSNALITDEESIAYEAPAIFIGSDYPLSFVPVDIYAKLGVASVSNDSSDDFLTIEESSSAQMAWGVGARYKLSRRWQLRSDFEAFSEDSSLLSLSLSYVFAGRPYQYKKAEPKPLVVIAEEPLSPSDEDMDKVIDEKDRCFTSKEHRDNVNEFGCAIYPGSFTPIYFASREFVIQLTQSQVDSYIDTLRQYPDTHMEIQGHTDSIGTEEYNQGLSQSRAETVMNFMLKHGVDKSRLSVRAFGEAQPVASNDTAEGRKKNRRVELFIRRE